MGHNGQMMTWSQKYAIVTIKHAVPILCFKAAGRSNYDCPDNTMVDCLYFYPFAFIVSNKKAFPRGVDLLEIVCKNESLINIKRDSWSDVEDNKLLPICWPCMISNNREDNTVDAIIGGGDLNSFSVSTKKITLH